MLEGVMAERTEREVLEHLVEICRDGERGFRAAAQYASTPQLKALFTQISEQRQGFAHDLEPHVNRLGGSALASGTGAGAVHRGWMNVKAHVPGHHDQTIIIETERGEHAAIKAYDEALSGVLPPTVINLVEAQREEMRGTPKRIRELTPAL
jgi:uncharacterized protein (TIGR02284 family)